MIQVTPLFPTALGTTTLTTDPSKILRMCSEHKADTVLNIGNTYSKDSYVLNHPELATVKKELEDRIRQFLYTVYKPSNKELGVYITQSWFNYSEAGQFHHPHTHDNSLFSGVLYLRLPGDGSIVFHRGSKILPVDLPTSEYGAYSSSIYRVGGLKEGDVCLFPSNLSHEVTTVSEGGTRVSLAFNSYIKGALGDQLGLTQLIL